MSQSSTSVTSAAAAGIEKAAISFRRRGRRQQLLTYLGVYTLAFAVILVVGFAPFWQHGRSLVWSQDGLSQQLLGLEYYRHYLHEIVAGLFNGHPHLPMYDFSIGTGDSTVTGLAAVSYLDVLNILVILVPKGAVEAFYVITIIARLYLTGLTFAAFGRYLNGRPWAIMLGSVIYVFSSFGTFADPRHPAFGIAMLYAPLLFLGLDKALKRQSSVLLLVTTFLVALSGYYFLFTMTVVAVVYAVIRLGYLRGWRRPKRLLTGLARAALPYLTGVLLAGIILVPAFKNFLNSAGGPQTRLALSSLVPDGGTLARSVAFAFAPYPGWSYLGLSGAVLLAACVVLTRKISRRRKAHIAAFGAVLALVYLLPAGKIVMNKFGFAPDSWVFVLSFFGAALLVYALPKMLEFQSWRYIGACAAGVYVYAIAVGSSEQYMTLRTRHIAMLGVVAAIVLLLALVLVQRAHRAGRPRAFRAYTAVFALLTCASVLGNVVVMYSSLGYHYAAEFEKAGAASAAYGAATAPSMAIKAADDGTYRIDDQTTNLRNAAMLGGYHSLSSYWSTSNGNYVKGLRALQLASMPLPFSPAGLNDRAALEALSSVRYQVRGAAATPPGPSYSPAPVQVAAPPEARIYRAGQALPFGYLYTKTLPYSAWQRLNAPARQEALVQAAVIPGHHGAGSPSRLTFSSTPLVTSHTLSKATWAKGSVQVHQARGSIHVSFDSPAGSETYLQLVGFKKKGSGQVDVTVTSGTSQKVRYYGTGSQFYVPRAGVLVNLGYSGSARTSATVSFPGPQDYDLKEIRAYSYPLTGLTTQLSDLSRHGLKDVKAAGNQLSGRLESNSPGTLVLTVPYDKGWSAKVDGRPAGTFRANELFTGIHIEPGSHRVELSYRTPWLTAGMISTAVGLLLLAGWALWTRRLRAAASEPPR